MPEGSPSHSQVHGSDGFALNSGQIRPHGAANQAATTGIFVSIYLLLLGFFVVMNSISNQELTRSDAVMESVHATFRNRFSPEAMTPQDQKNPEFVAPSDRFVGELEGVLESVLGLSNLSPALGGRLIEVEIPADALFIPGDVGLRTDREELFRQLAILIDKAPRGERRSVEMVVSMPKAAFGDAFRDADSWQSLVLRRAGALARALVAQGISPASLSVGVRPVEPGEAKADLVIATFVTRPLSEDQVRFSPPKLGAGS